MKSDLVDVAGCLHHETDKAILFSDTGSAKDAVWLPKSQCEFATYYNTAGRGSTITVTLPEWLAKDKGLI